MTNLRAALTALLAALLVLGWGGAALAAMGGTAADWAVRTDAAPVRLLALVALVGAVALAFVPDRDAAKEEAPR